MIAQDLYRVIEELREELPMTFDRLYQEQQELIAKVYARGAIDLFDVIDLIDECIRTGHTRRSH